MVRRIFGLGLSGACAVALAVACGGHSEERLPAKADDGGTGNGGVSHPELCDDGTRNGNESDIDCGGPDCETCVPDSGCNRHDDCTSGVCRAGTCRAPGCTDEVRNADETDVDCGGSCAPCATGKGCETSVDCESRFCESGQCSAGSCVDALMNGDETDIDCGGSCEGCSLGQGCLSGTDCQSAICGFVDLRCASCSDGLQNGVETDIDCGGPNCAPCGEGSGCSQETDCESGFCTYSTSPPSCRPARCDNQTKDGDETDVDCGGSTCELPCEGLADGCLVTSDCWSIYRCTNGFCQKPCGSDADCGELGQCIDRICVYCATNDDCMTDYECFHGACRHVRPG